MHFMWTKTRKTLTAKGRMLFSMKSMNQNTAKLESKVQYDLFPSLPLGVISTPPVPIAKLVVISQSSR